jgi:N-hydroxyarylamine O-acetyltransferase
MINTDGDADVPREGLMDETVWSAYLQRIAVPRPLTADTVTLHVLHRAHQLTVPFENLGMHLSETISLTDEALIDKIVRRHRGGICYELNGAFALLLQSLDVEVTRVGARVYGEDGRLSIPFDHMALVVRPSDGSGPWLADVGFGRHSVYPLLFDSRGEQDDPGGRFLLADNDDGDIDVFRDGLPQYRIERRPRALSDFAPTCWWQQSSPDSHFTHATICSRLTETGRVFLSDRTLIITTNGDRSERQLPSDQAVLDAYLAHFGITLDHVPNVLFPPTPEPPAPAETPASTGSPAPAGSPAPPGSQPGTASAGSQPSPAPAGSQPSPAPAASRPATAPAGSQPSQGSTGSQAAPASPAPATPVTPPQASVPPSPNSPAAFLSAASVSSPSSVDSPTSPGPSTLASSAAPPASLAPLVPPASASPVHARASGPCLASRPDSGPQDPPLSEALGAPSATPASLVP